MRKKLFYALSIVLAVACTACDKKGNQPTDPTNNPEKQYKYEYIPLEKVASYYNVKTGVFDVDGCLKMLGDKGGVVEGDRNDSTGIRKITVAMYGSVHSIYEEDGVKIDTMFYDDPFSEYRITYGGNGLIIEFENYVNFIYHEEGVGFLKRISPYSYADLQNMFKNDYNYLKSLHTPISEEFKFYWSKYDYVSENSLETYVIDREKLTPLTFEEMLSAFTKYPWACNSSKTYIFYDNDSDAQEHIEAGAVITTNGGYFEGYLNCEKLFEFDYEYRFAISMD